MTQHGYIGKHARTFLRRRLDYARSIVAFDHRRELPSTAARMAYLVAEELWRDEAGMFAHVTLDTLDGSDTDMARRIRALRLARRYRDVCSLAYLGPPQ